MEKNRSKATGRQASAENESAKASSDARAKASKSASGAKNCKNCK